MSDSKEIDLSDYNVNNEWELTQTSGRVDVIHYGCCPEPYHSIEFNITLKRRTTFYTYILVMPAVLLTFLIPLMFLLPFHAQERMTLGKNSRDLSHLKESMNIQLWL